MENFNIPVYRGKRVDNGEYVMGWYSDPILIKGKLYLSITNKEGTFRIDPTTLAIHFEDMLDSEDNKVFASLSKDGKGGDKFHIGDKRLNYIALIHHNSLMAKQENTYGSLIGQGYAECTKWNVIGIQE